MAKANAAVPGSECRWQAEADAVTDAARDARANLARAAASFSRSQPLWSPQDCHHAATDLAACHDEDVAAGLRLGRHWTPPDLLAAVGAPVMLLLAPEAPGINRLQDATALRGPDRDYATRAVRARTQVIDAGHCLHRDAPTDWIQAVAAFTTDHDPPAS